MPCITWQLVLSKYLEIRWKHRIKMCASLADWHSKIQSRNCAWSWKTNWKIVHSDRDIELAWRGTMWFFPVPANEKSHERNAIFWCGRRGKEKKTTEMLKEFKKTKIFWNIGKNAYYHMENTLKEVIVVFKSY